MGTFVTDPTSELFEDKQAAPGIARRSGWSEANVLEASEINALRDAAYDLRTHALGVASDVDALDTRVDAVEAGGVSVVATGSTTSRTLASRFADVINIRNFGAVGDGTTNDTAAIQAAITAAEAAGGGTVFFPAGQYVVTTLTLTGSKCVHLVGVGWGHNSSGAGGSVLKHSGTGGLLHVGDDDIGHQTCDIQIKNLRLQGNGTEVTAALTIQWMHNTTVSDTRIHGFGWNGIQLDEAYAFDLVNCYINNNGGSGFYANEQNAFITIERCAFLANAANGIWFSSGDCDGTRIIGNDIEGSACGLRIDTTSVTGIQPAAIVVAYNYFEGNTGPNALFGTDAGTTYLKSLSFTGNNVNAGSGGGASPATNKFVFDRCTDPQISGNYFGYADVELTANCIGGVWPRSNTMAGGSVRTSVNMLSFDQYDASDTLIGGGTPRLVLQNSGWSHKHRVGVTYSGGMMEVSTNLKSTGATAGNLDDTADSGFGLRIDSAAGLDLIKAPAGANPRTISRVNVMFGTGTPEGAVTAPPGSMFMRTDGGAGTTLYVKESGSGDTGWVGK